MIKDLEFLRSANSVKRFHTVDLLVPETVGHHAANVATMVVWMYYPKTPSGRILSAALIHDAPELKTGDVPAPTKWAHPDMEDALKKVEGHVWNELGWMPYDYNVTDLERNVLKFCDMSDLCLKCKYEASLGNSTVLPILYRGLDVLKNRKSLFGKNERLVRKGDTLIKHIEEGL